MKMAFSYGLPHMGHTSVDWPIGAMSERWKWQKRIKWRHDDDDDDGDYIFLNLLLSEWVETFELKVM